MNANTQCTHTHTHTHYNKRNIKQLNNTRTRKIYANYPHDASDSHTNKTPSSIMLNHMTPVTHTQTKHLLRLC